MAKIKYTKNELKTQKDDLERFKRFLPTLILKKQQLQMEIHRINAQKKEKESSLESARTSIMQWVDVFGEDVATVVPALLGPAVFNATGVWVDDYPITPDKVLAALGKLPENEVS